MEILKKEKNLFSEVTGKKFTRREFLKLSSVTGTAAIASGLFLDNKLGIFREATAAEKEAKTGTWIYTCCNMCGGQTGIKVNVIDGVIRKIEPNEHNPIGVANIYNDFVNEKSRGGRMCPKGNSAIKSLYDPDRLKTPMKRIGERGSGQWEPITWEQAIEEAASKLTEIKKKYGAESLVWFSEDHSFTHIQIDFCDLFGTPNYHNHANLCDVSRKRGFSTVMGDERPLADFQNADYVLLFGWNPLGAMKWAHLPAIINRGREKGAKLVVVDPVFSATAAKADEWISLRPGTDGAMALAIGNVIVTEKLYNKDFIENWTIGFDEYEKFIADKTPEWQEKITSVPADVVRRIARELASSKSAVIDVWSGPGHHTNATQGSRAVAMIPALLGFYDKSGTMISPDKKGGKHIKFSVDKSKAQRVDGLGTKYPFGHGSGIYIEAREAMLTGKPYPVKAAVFVFQNWVMSVPNTAKNLEAIKNMEFVIVVDTHLSETAELADLIVPGSNFLERYDLNSNWVTFPALGLRQPVVKSWINGMTEYEFVKAVGKKLGLKDKNGKGFEKTDEEAMNEELKAGINISIAELRAMDGATWIGGKTTYEKYSKSAKVPEGAVVNTDTKVVKDKDGKYIGVSNGFWVVNGFKTPSGKIEFYSKQLKDKGYDPLPVYTEPEDKPTSEYPFYLIGWKQAEHTHTRTFNNEWLMEMKSDNPLWMNTDTGKKLGLNDGDEVWIESPISKAKGKVHLTEGIHPEVVGLHHGYGHWALGSVAKGKGVADGQFFPGKAEAISGQAITKEVGVKIYKA